MKPSDLQPSRWTADVVIAIVVGAILMLAMLEDPTFFPETWRAWRVPLSAAAAVGAGWLCYKVNRNFKR